MKKRKLQLLLYRVGRLLQKDLSRSNELEESVAYQNSPHARVTCVECHWPQKFYSRKLVMQKHYLSDERNSD